MNNATIVGAGLAGCEAALQLAKQGYNVTIFDSKPTEVLPPYNLTTYAELVCNNSLGNLDTQTPLGLLLAELKLLGSKTIAIADKCRVDDQTFYAVDKKVFSQTVTSELFKNNIKVINRQIDSIPEDDYVIIATGPLTNKALIEDLSQKYGINEYYFSDSSSPVVDITTVDINSSNVNKITDDLYAISISDLSFKLFCDELMNQSIQVTCHDNDMKVDFEKCRSIEQLAKLGIDVLYLKRFKYDYCNTPCLLLRRESALHDGFILVGCMTTLKHTGQLAAFRKIPELRNCKFIKYGRMHRNTFFFSPKILNEFFQIKGTNIFVVGQLSGVDGYAPAIASGLVAAMRIIYGNNMKSLPKSTMVGGLSKYVSNTCVVDFQPMCASFSLIEKTNKHIEQIISEYLSSI